MNNLGIHPAYLRPGEIVEPIGCPGAAQVDPSTPAQEAVPITSASMVSEGGSALMEIAAVYGRGTKFAGMAAMYEVGVSQEVRDAA